MQSKEKICHSLLKEAQEYGGKFLTAINECVTHFHTVNYCKETLGKNGFTELKETNKWVLEAGKSYFFTRNNSTIFAFSMGKKISAATGIDCFKVVGCHTDSPVFKLAPVSKLPNKCGYQ
jgi:aspartyl aminopeptidase